MHCKTRAFASVIMKIGRHSKYFQLCCKVVLIQLINWQHFWNKCQFSLFVRICRSVPVKADDYCRTQQYWPLDGGRGYNLGINMVHRCSSLVKYWMMFFPSPVFFTLFYILPLYCRQNTCMNLFDRLYLIYNYIFMLFTGHQRGFAGYFRPF